MAGARGLVHGTHAYNPPHGGRTRAFRKGCARFSLRHAWFVAFSAWLVALLIVMALSACAIAPMPDGSGYAVGMRMSGDGTSAAELAQTAGKVAGFLGIPGGDAIGQLVATGLGIVGVGGWASSRARRLGEQAGWEEREKAAAVQQPLPAQGTTGAS